MRSATLLQVAVGPGGTTRAVALRAEAPQLLRVTGRGGPGEALTVHLLGGAAGPLGGDESTFTVDVAAGARLAVRSVAATVVQPGAHGTASTACVHASVGARAELDWWPEPVIAVAGCDHHLRCTIDVAPGARLRWVDEVVCGRAGESGGRLQVRQRVCVGARPVADHEVTVGPGAVGPGRHGTARVVVTAIAVGHPPGGPGAPVITPEVRAARMEPEPGVTLWIGLGREVEAVRAALAALGLSSAAP